MELGLCVVPPNQLWGTELFIWENNDFVNYSNLPNPVSPAKRLAIVLMEKKWAWATMYLRAEESEWSRIGNGSGNFGQCFTFSLL